MGRFSIAKKKEIWTATWFGHFLKLSIFIILLFIFAKTIHPFLAKTKSVESKIMVAEGFIPDFAIETSMSIFNEGNYTLMIITGKKKLKGSYIDEYENDGLHSAATLGKMGFDTTKIKVISIGDDIRKDRTYATAIAVKHWFQKYKKPCRFNVVTTGCHARRSHLLFKKAVGKDAAIGIIAIEDIRYNPNKWW
ncbi:MAG: YdcF family protein, partial [Bacteroidales bacterium]|nr:YdcF family protein [Bacteroidales bacterium]